MTKDQQQLIFNYFVENHQVQLLDSDFIEIEHILGLLEPQLESHQISEETIKTIFIEAFSSKDKSCLKAFAKFKKNNSDLFSKN